MIIDPVATKTVVVQNSVYRIVIEYDQYLDESPREWSNVGVMACAHKRYNLGDERSKIGYDFTSQLAVAGSWEEMEEWIQDHFKPVVLLPIYLYDHSGLAVRTTPFSCQWDSGQVGFIYATSESVRENFIIDVITPEYIVRTRECLISEVDIYNRYLQGEVFSSRIEHEGEVVDSHFGFYGTVEECMQEAEAELRAQLKLTA